MTETALQLSSLISPEGGTKLQAVIIRLYGRCRNCMDLIRDRIVQINVAAKSSLRNCDSTELICCVACTESFPVRRVHYAPCGDAHCRTCLRRIFEDALRDVSSFPPRCCQIELPVSSVQQMIGWRMTIKSELKAIELTRTNGIYYSNHK